MNKHEIPVLAKAIRVLTLLATPPRAMTPSALAKELGIAQATAYRILRTYEQAGWIRRGADGAYALSPAMPLMFGEVLPERRLAAIAEPELARLSERVGLTVKLSVRRGSEAFTVVRCDPAVAMLTTGAPGTSFHICYGSSGAALALDIEPAELRRIVAAAPAEVWTRQTPEQFLARVDVCRRRSYCLDRGSYHPDVHSVSAALRDGDRVLGSISALALPNDLPDGRVAKLGKELLQTARRCVELLGHHASKGLE